MVIHILQHSIWHLTWKNGLHQRHALASRLSQSPTSLASRLSQAKSKFFVDLEALNAETGTPVPIPSKLSFFFAEADKMWSAVKSHADASKAVVCVQTLSISAIEMFDRSFRRGENLVLVESSHGEEFQALHKCRELRIELLRTTRSVLAGDCSSVLCLFALFQRPFSAIVDLGLLGLSAGQPGPAQPVQKRPQQAVCQSSRPPSKSDQANRTRTKKI